MDTELRAARIRLMNADALTKELSAEFGKLQVEEAERNATLERASAHEARTFTFANQIRTETVQKCMHTLDVWSRAAPGCDITILLNSPGGDAFAGFGLMDFLSELKAAGHKITIKVVGAAMSMAVTLLQIADERVIGPNSYLLIHEVSNDSGEMTFSDHSDQIKKMQRVQDRVFKFLADRSNLSMAEIKRRAKKSDWMLDAEEALKYGFVDRIAG